MNATSKPEIGTPGCYQIGSDRHPVTVIAVSPSGHRLVTRRAKATMVGGSALSEHQEYEFEADPNGEIIHFTRRGDGRYRLVGATTYGTLSLGRYGAYRDPSF